jgi:ABC-type sugar transport system permease subunit
MQEAAAPRAIGKTRGPMVVWLLAIVTFGIYFGYWYYKVNQELREFDSSIDVNPERALLAQFVPIANWVSFFNTGERIETAQDNHECSAAIGLLLFIFVAATGVIYYQAHLNKMWAAAGPVMRSQSPR